MDTKSTPYSPTVPLVETTTTDINSINSRDLFQGRQEICIEHGDQIYRLRTTRQGKLILTK